MTPIKNSSWNLKTLAEPSLCIGLALLAGCTRLIEYFPGSTRSGLLMAATLTSTTSALYDRKVYHPYHGYLKTLLGKTATIALTTIASVYLAKPLNAKGVSLSFNGGIKLGAFHSLIATLFTYIKIASPPKEMSLQEQHHYFEEHHQEWRDLTVEKRTEWMQKFYNANLSAISLLNLEINLQNPMISGFFIPIGYLLQEGEAARSNVENSIKLELLSKEKLSWIREYVNSWNIVAAKDKLESQKVMLSLMLQCQKKGLPLPLWDVDKELIEFVKDNSEYIEMFYQECQNRPLYFFSGDFSELFKDKEPLPTLDTLIKTLNVSEVQAMHPELIEGWNRGFGKNEDVWDALSEDVRIVFTKRCIQLQIHVCMHCAQTPGNLSWINDLSLEHFQSLSVEEKEIYIALLGRVPSTEGIAFEKIYALNEGSEKNCWSGGLFARYHLSSKVVTQAQEDPKLREQIKAQFEKYLYDIPSGFEKLASDNDYGFFSLSLFLIKELLKSSWEMKRVSLPITSLPKWWMQLKRMKRFLSS